MLHNFFFTYSCWENDKVFFNKLSRNSFSILVTLFDIITMIIIIAGFLFFEFQKKKEIHEYFLTHFNIRDCSLHLKNSINQNNYYIVNIVYPVLIVEQLDLIREFNKSFIKKEIKKEEECK